jgi:hypothetical protein
METHDFFACAEKPLHKGTFFRKDHLRQHLRLFHKTSFNEKVMNVWVKRDLKIQSRCGFCDLKMGTWTERIEHLAAHFESGQKMTDWSGDYGFEPHIEDMVENWTYLHHAPNSHQPHSQDNATNEAQMNPILEDPKTPLGNFDTFPSTLKPTHYTNPLTDSEIDELVLVGLSCG